MKEEPINPFSFRRHARSLLKEQGESINTSLSKSTYDSSSLSLEDMRNAVELIMNNNTHNNNNNNNNVHNYIYNDSILEPSPVPVVRDDVVRDSTLLNPRDVEDAYGRIGLYEERINQLQEEMRLEVERINQLQERRGNYTMEAIRGNTQVVSYPIPLTQPFEEHRKFDKPNTKERKELHTSLFKNILDLVKLSIALGCCIFVGNLMYFYKFFIPLPLIILVGIGELCYYLLLYDYIKDIIKKREFGWLGVILSTVGFLCYMNVLTTLFTRLR